MPEGTRWEAHAETDDGNHMEEFTDFSEETGLATISGLTSLKAAHGKDPIDKTSFPGLDKVIVTEEGDKKEDTGAAGDTVEFQTDVQRAGRPAQLHKTRRSGRS